MTNLVFTKTSESSYITTLTQEHISYIEKIVSELSLNEVDKWEQYITDSFIDTLVVRYVSACFFKQHEEDISKTHRFLLLDITYDKRIITASLGLFQVEEGEPVKYIAGVMYK